MKLEKKHWVIIGVIVAIIVIWYLFFKKKKSESGYRMAAGSVRSDSTIAPVMAGMTSLESHPKCKPGTIWSDTFGKCIPDTPENIKWPPWLKIGIKRVCPQGFVLDPVTKGCVRAYDL